jgi:hypothetical protein
MRYINNPALIRDMDTNLIVRATGRNVFILPQRMMKKIEQLHFGIWTVAAAT